MTSSHSLTVHTCDGLPSEPEARKAMILQLTADLLADFEYGLKEPRLGLWKRYGLDPPDDFDKVQIIRAFDEFIISQACIYGTYLMCVEPVQLRLTQWHNEPDGAELIERLGRAISLGIKASRGQARFPIDDPSLYEFKQDTVPELRALRSRLRAKVASRHSSPSPTEIKTLVEQEIQDSPAAFPRLSRNLVALLHFLEQKREMANLFALGQISATRFFYEFSGWSTNRDPEKLRQMISRLRPGDA